MHGTGDIRVKAFAPRPSAHVESSNRPTGFPGVRRFRNIAKKLLYSEYLLLYLTIAYLLVAPQLVPGLLSSTPEPDADDGKLTNREKQILQLIAEGKSNKEIAALLDLSVNTVSVHRANLMEALGIHRTAELVLYAVRKGLVHIP